jgi:FtsP/CotA-like multicopper oxidase with cupredoxin domain
MMRHDHDGKDSSAERFPTDTEGLQQARPPRIVELSDSARFDLRIAPVAKRLPGGTVRMIAYNGSIPGPTLRVQQDSEIVVDVTNEADLEATVHWHGLRLDNAYDGTLETQAPVDVGQSFSYRIRFPDPGVYWYHPHIREDYGQEMGLYGNILVVPTDQEYWPPANREVLLTLDDILLEDGQIAPFSRSETTYVAMGRFGNTMLIGGETAPELEAKLGEVVRFYLTNTANTRVFNVRIDGARMKLVGGDSGRCEAEEFVDQVLLAPSERIVVDVLFETPGLVALEHRHPDRSYRLASVTVGGDRAEPSLNQEFDHLRVNADMVAERQRLNRYVDVEPDKTLAFVAEMDMDVPEGPIVYACPMHPEVVGADEGRCPKCGMKLLAIPAVVSYSCPMHPEVTSAEQGRCPHCGMKLIPAQLLNQTAESAEGSQHHERTDETPAHGQPDQEAVQHLESTEHHEHAGSGGIEWEDDMVDINRITTPANMRWKLVDRTTGAANDAIDWRFTVGDRVKIRLVNEMDSDHPMHHPFHIHGAGRFLVMSRDGMAESNLVWKDTVLVRTGETVDLLLDVTNPGIWMAHCHIAEHHESGMMFNFTVAAHDNN